MVGRCFPLSRPVVAGGGRRIGLQRAAAATSVQLRSAPPPNGVALNFIAECNFEATSKQLRSEHRLQHAEKLLEV